MSARTATSPDQATGFQTAPMYPLIVAYLLMAGYNIAHTAPGEGDRIALSVSALLYAAAMLVVVVGQRLRLSTPVAWTVVVVTALAYWVGASALTDGRPSESTYWQMLAIPPIQILLGLRGRPVEIVVLQLAVYAMVLLPLSPAEQAAEIPVLLANSALAPIAVFLSFVVRPQLLAIAALRDTRSRAARDQAAAEAALVARGQRLDWIDATAGPTLRRLARTRVPDPALGESCRVLEAGIRDVLRAPALTGRELDDHVAAARVRGVDVTLLDDGLLATDPATAARLRDHLARIVDDADGDRLVIRIPPSGRDQLATVMLTRAGRTDGIAIRRQDL